MLCSPRKVAQAKSVKWTTANVPRPLQAATRLDAARLDRAVTRFGTRLARSERTHQDLPFRSVGCELILCAHNDHSGFIFSGTTGSMLKTYPWVKGELSLLDWEVTKWRIASP